MKLLVRKIERAKWMQKDVVNGATPSADAVTGSLRTKNNTLSVWQIENLDELEDAVIAFVCQGCRRPRSFLPVSRNIMNPIPS
jgi:hypothetical protein